MVDQPVEKRRTSVRAATNELGRTGLKHFGGTLYEEFLPQLQGQRGQKIYKEMSENSPVIGAMLFAVESLLRSVEWTVEPASESDEDIEAAEFLESCKEDMSHTWEDFISEVLSMLVFGWSYFEVVYKRRRGIKASPSSEHDDGRIGWRKFALRSQETLYRWEIDESGGIKGMWQYPIPSTPSASRQAHDVVFIPIEKAMLFRTTSTKNSPEGRSVLRNSYRPWYFSKRIEEIEAVGLERDLAGIPIARVPIELLGEGRSADQLSTYRLVKDIVTKTKRDQQEGIVFPRVLDPETGNDLYDFELLSSGGRRSFDTGSIIQRYMQQQAMTVMADFILLGHENVGSFALSSDKTELFAVALGAWLNGIEEILNRHAVPRLFELNTFGVDEYPEFRHGDIEKPDIQQVGAYIQALAGAGAPLFPDLELENRLREFGDLPQADPEERDRLMATQSMASFFGGDGEPGSPPPQTSSPPQGRSPSSADTARADEDLQKSVIRPRYFDGTRWKPLHGRHRFLKDLREKVE
jgi:hypothetical protein